MNPISEMSVEEKERIHNLGIEILEEDDLRFNDEATRIIKNYIEKEKEN